MQRILIIIGTLTVLSLCGGCPQTEPQRAAVLPAPPTQEGSTPTPAQIAGGASIQWLDSMDAALAEAKRTKKPLMVDFYATWCGPCKVLDEQVYTEKSVIEQAQHWIAVKVDVDKDQKTAVKYGINSMPTIVLMKPDGTVVQWVSGVLQPAGMVEFMQSSLDKARAG